MNDEFCEECLHWPPERHTATLLRIVTLYSVYSDCMQIYTLYSIQCIYYILTVCRYTELGLGVVSARCRQSVCR